MAPKADRPRRSFFRRTAASSLAGVLLALLCALPLPGAAQTAAKPQQYLYVLRLQARYHDQNAWTEADRAAVGRHFKRLAEGVAAGTVILAGKTGDPLDKAFGLVIFEADNEPAARHFMESDPAVTAGIMTATLHPYSVALIRK